MCGITGFAGIKTDSSSLISSMVKKIKHRGPDDDGYCFYENLAIGMTRLSIVDIESGMQPMHTDDGILSIVFNGEIYNYLELATEYKTQGGTLKTSSDTEIILALYEKFQEKCLEKLQGMFAFAILNRREKSLFIARDRIGIKPLYFCQQNEKLIFASEIKSFLASSEFNPEVNLTSISDYLSLRYVPGPNSLFKNVERLPPGHWMKWQAGKTKQKCYWKPCIREKSRLSDLELQEEFDYLFEKTIDMHRMGEVPHGAYLSGGLDSSSIVTALAKQNNIPLKTFTVGFNWNKDELADARRTATLIGTEHHEIICKPTDFEYLPHIVWHADEPLGDPIVLPTYMLAKAARKEVKIVLTGEGADEILGGYLFHKAAYLGHKYQKWIPEFFHKMIIRPMVNKMPVSLLNKGFNYPAYLGNSGKNRLLSFLEQARKKNPSELVRFFVTLFDDKEQNNLLNQIFSVDHQETHLKTPSKSSILDEILQSQYATWLPDNILMRQDKMSMAHGLEARVPFLDHKLVEFMETIPNHLKLTMGKNKILLRNYVKKYGCEKVAKRKKSAFYFPMEEYFGNAVFQDILNSTLSEKAVRSRGLFKYEAIKNLTNRMKCNDFLAAKQIFSLVSLELWFQIFIDNSFKFNQE